MKKSQFESLIREVIRETIRKVDGKYVVYPEKGGKRLGTHSTKKAAEKQLTAIHLNKEAYEKGKVIVYHNFQGVDADENIPGTKKVLNVADCIGNEPGKDYNYFTTEKKQYVEDMIKDASGDGWKKFPPIVAIPHPVVSGKYAVIDGNHRLGAFIIGKLPQINATILSDDKILLAERGAEWDENKLPKTMPLADAKNKGVKLKEYFATQPLKVPSNENYADGKVNESGYEEAWELLGQPVPEIKNFVKQLGLKNDDATAKKVGAIIDSIKDSFLPANKIPGLKNLANKGNDTKILKAVQQISGKPDAEQQYTKLMQARDAGEKRNRGYDVSGLIKAVKTGNYESPVLLQLPSGLYVIGGRTRLYAALALGVKAKVKIITSDTFKQVKENYADGKVKGKSRPGRVKRAGASCKGSVTDLRAKAKKYGGEKGKMYHWCANMKSGRKK